MLQVDVANRICRPTCERFFASLERELGDAARYDQTTLRLCRALFTRADEIGATYHELFSSTAMALLEVAYKTGHAAEDILAMIGPKLEEVAAQHASDVQASTSTEASQFGRSGSRNDPRVLTLLRALFGDGKARGPSEFEVLHAAANALLLVVRDTAMSADATNEAIRRLANASYAS
jgi:hypothetical protein